MALSDTFSSNRRGKRSVQRILDAAAKLFGKEGYARASMTEVARAAGVSKGLLHYHFRSKEHLLIEAQRATFVQISRRFQDRFDRGDVGLETALEALDALWQALVDMRYWAPFMLETMSLAAQQEPVREQLDAFYDEAMELLNQAIDRAFANQEPLLLPTERLARVVRAALHGMVVELAYARTDADIAQLQQTYADLRDIFSQVALMKPISLPLAQEPA